MTHFLDRPIVATSAVRAPMTPAIVIAPEVAIARPAMIDAVVHATRFATDMCACTDLACTVAVDVRYRDQLGSVAPTLEGRALHEALARASACQLPLQPPAPAD